MCCYSEALCPDSGQSSSVHPLSMWPMTKKKAEGAPSSFKEFTQLSWAPSPRLLTTSSSGGLPHRPAGATAEPCLAALLRAALPSESQPPCNHQDWQQHSTCGSVGSGPSCHGTCPCTDDALSLRWPTATFQRPAPHCFQRKIVFFFSPYAAGSTKKN